MGSTVIATIVLSVEQDALVLPRGAFLTTGGQKVVYVINGQLAEKTSVSFGDIEGNWVQVNSGLKVGQQVITSGYQNYISHTAITLAGAK